MVVSYVGKGGISPDSIAITAYKSPTNFKKHYFKIKRSDEENSKTNPDISLYQTDYRDRIIYTTYHKFSTSDYKPQALDSTFIEKREQMQFDVNYGDHYQSDFVLNPFEEIVIRNTTNCGGGRLGGPLVCPVYLSYYKMRLPQKTIYFKEIKGMNQFKIIPIFNKKYLFFHPDDYATNSRLFLIDE